MENMEINNNISAFYKGKSVFITGHTGFKGSWLAYWLTEMGANVIGFALPAIADDDHFNLINLRNRVTHIEGDILNEELLKSSIRKYQPEIVFHLAAQALVRLSYQEPKLTFNTNITGSVNFLEAIRNTDSVKSVIYVTSDKAYKNREWIWGYRENDELGGHDPYSASKAAAEIVFSSYMDSYFYAKAQLGLASVRAGNVIGGGDWAQDRILPDCIRALSIEKPIEIRNPKATRPWQHVLEPLSGYLLLGMKLFNEPGIYSGVWNFGPHTASIKTVKELAEEVIKHYGSGSLFENYNAGAVHEASLLHLNCDKSNIRLNWHPRWDFDQTIKYTTLWYKKYLAGENPEELTKNDINNYMVNYD